VTGPPPPPEPKVEPGLEVKPTEEVKS
jgi:hypothetical protein